MPSQPLLSSNTLLGYYKDEGAFLKRVEEDATTFKPIGQLIYSYTRPSPSSSSKGKRKRTGNTQPLDPESEDAVEFEVYHASLHLFDITAIY